MNKNEFEEQHEHQETEDVFVGLDPETRDEIWDVYCWCGEKVGQKRWSDGEGFGETKQCGIKSEDELL